MPAAVVFKSKDLAKSLEADKAAYEALLRQVAIITNKIQEISREINYDEREFYRKAALTLAIETFKQNAGNLCVGTLVNAIQRSGEFNYEPYIGQFLGAFFYHIDRIINVNTQTLLVTVNFDPLGDVSQWGMAVSRARDELKIGSTRGRAKGKTKKYRIERFQGEPSSGELSSIMWRYKVYGVAREGLKVMHWRKKGRQKGVYIDETSKYSGLYHRTITTRLANINPFSAPYWYIINYGNVGVGFPDSIGTPYPIVPPTNFVAILNRKLTIYLSDLVNHYRDTIEKEFHNNYLRYAERELESTTKRDVNFETLDDLRRAGPVALKMFAQMAAMSKNINAETAKLNKVFDYLKLTDGRIEYYISKAGNLQYNLRNKRGNYTTKPR